MKDTGHAPNVIDDKKFVFWRRPTEYLLYGLLIAALVLGGSGNNTNFQLLSVGLVAAALVPVAIAAGAGQRFAALPLAVRAAAIAVPLIPLLQLIPIPAGIAERLPGRELPGAVYALIGTRGDPHSLSLVQAQTLFAFSLLLPAAAAFLASLTLDRASRTRVVWALLGTVLVSILIGLVQFTSKGTALDYYNNSHRGSLLGFFANRNHQGLLMAIAGAFGISLVHSRIRNTRISAASAALVAMVFLIAAVGTASRAGIGLTILAVSAVYYAYFLHGKLRLPFVFGGAVLASAGLYLVTFSTTVETALDRFSNIEENGRLEIWEKSYPALEQYFPWGAGIGSYTAVYPPVEQLENVNPLYFNRMHNDYLELLLEAGLPGMLVLALFLWALGGRLYHVWQSGFPRGSFGLASGLAIIVVGLHSIVDYPLRTQSHAVLFAIACAFFLVSPLERANKANNSLDSGARSIRFKYLSLAGQGMAISAFAAFANYQHATANFVIDPEASLVNSDSAPLPPARLAAAKRALMRAPLDQGLLNAVYASEAKAGLDAAQRRAYTDVLSQLGWRDTSTQQNLLLDAAERNDLSTALDHMDALLRREKLTEQILPLLQQLEREPEGIPLLAGRLSKEPNWRQSYFEFGQLLSEPGRIDARLALFTYMGEQGLAVSRRERLTTANALFGAGRRADLASMARDMMPLEARDDLIFDSDFDRLQNVPADERRQTLPFEWRTINRSGVSTQIIAEEWSSRMIIRWNGRGAPLIASTLTFLEEDTRPRLEVALENNIRLTALDSLRFSLLCPGQREVLFVRGTGGGEKRPGFDNRTAYFLAEREIGCSYPQIVILGRPQIGDRGADLSIDSIKLSLP